jgi:hypothetical protein
VSTAGIKESGKVEHIARMESAHDILVGLHEGERSLRKPESKWEDNIKIILRERRWLGFCWTWDVVPWRIAANMAMNFRFLLTFEFLADSDMNRFYPRTSV